MRRSRRISRRIAVLAVAAAAACGLALSGAAPALASPVIADISYTVVASAFHATSSNGSECVAVLLSEQVAAKDPAYVSAYIENVHAGKACVGWLESSANGGKTWTIVSALQIVPSVAGVSAWAKTGEHYDGPGHKARACFQIGSGTRSHCTRGVGLAASKAPATGFPDPVSYIRHQVATGTPVQECTALVASTTLAKNAKSDADGLFTGFGARCTGWVQVSSDGGKTWRTDSRFFVFTSKAPASVWAFTATHEDGPGLLVRACVTLGSGKAHCTAPW